MSKKVISKLEAATRYTDTAALGAPSPPRSVTIKGLHRGAAVVTEVSDADAAFLAAHPHFIEHQARGFVKIVEAG